MGVIEGYLENFAKLLSGTYELLEQVGVGGSGRVFKAKDLNSGNFVAIKLLHPQFREDSVAIKRFKREVAVTSDNGNSNLIKTYSVKQIEDIHYIVMDFIEGNNLSELIQEKGKLNLGTSVAYGLQILKALKSAHKNGVIHRDLKPGNIMVKTDGEVVVTDFGLAGLTGDFTKLSRTGITMGTPQYIAPELWKGEKGTEASDIYAFGIVLYELLTGRLPFESDSDYGYLQKHLKSRPDFKALIKNRIPFSLRKLIKRCLHKNPQKRFNGVDDIIFLLKSKQALSRSNYCLDLFLNYKSAAVSLILLGIGGFILFKTDTFRAKSKILNLYVEPFIIKSRSKEVEIFKKKFHNCLVDTLNGSESLKAISLGKKEGLINELKGGYTVKGELIEKGKGYSIKFEVLDSSKNRSQSKEFETDGANIFLLADTVARKVKNTLGINSIAEKARKKVSPIYVTTSSPKARELYFKGVELFVERQTIAAIATMKQAIKYDPEFAMAHYKIANYLNIDYEIEEATFYIEKAFELSDKITEDENFLIKSLYAQIVEKDELKEIDILLERLKEKPDSVELIRQLAVKYILVEDWDNALSECYKIYEKYSKEIGELYISYIYIKLGALNRTKKFIFTDETAVKETFWRIATKYLIYISEHKYKMSMKLCDQMVFMMPHNHRGYWFAGWVYLLQEDFDNAFISFDKVAIIKNRDSINRGFVHLALGQFKEAVNHFLKCSKLYKTHTISYELDILALFRVYLITGQKEKLYKLVEVLENQIGDSYIYLLNKGMLFLEDKNLEGLKEVNKSFKILPPNYNIAKRRFCEGVFDALLLMTEGKPASQNLEQVYKKYPCEVDRNNHHALISYYLAEAYEREGKEDRQLKAYKRLQNLTLGRVYYGDYYALSFYKSGCIYQKRGDLGEATRNFKRFLELWGEGDRDLLPQIEDAEKRLKQISGAR